MLQSISGPDVLLFRIRRLDTEMGEWGTFLSQTIIQEILGNGIVSSLKSSIASGLRGVNVSEVL